MNPKVAYLLGSGLSIPFGLPGVSELTERILTSDQFASLHTDQCYHVGLPTRLYQSGEISAKIAVDFLRHVQGILSHEATLNRIPEPNYCLVKHRLSDKGVSVLFLNLE